MPRARGQVLWRLTTLFRFARDGRARRLSPFRDANSCRIDEVRKKAQALARYGIEGTGSNRFRSVSTNIRAGLKSGSVLSSPFRAASVGCVHRSLALSEALFHVPYRWQWTAELAGLVPDAKHRTVERGCGAQSRGAPGGQRLEAFVFFGVHRALIVRLMGRFRKWNIKI